MRQVDPADTSIVGVEDEGVKFADDRAVAPIHRV